MDATLSLPSMVAASYAWQTSTASNPLSKAFRSIVAAIKALWGGYIVSIEDEPTKKLIADSNNSIASNFLRQKLSSRTIEPVDESNEESAYDLLLQQYDNLPPVTEEQLENLNDEQKLVILKASPESQLVMYQSQIYTLKQLIEKSIGSDAEPTHVKWDQVYKVVEQEDEFYDAVEKQDDQNDDLAPPKQ